MANNSEEESSRYISEKNLGEFPPWRGDVVSDALCGKKYLRFILPAPPHISPSLNDLRMRVNLFTAENKIIREPLSLHKTGESIIFLLPYSDLIPLKKFLPSMQNKEISTNLNILTSQILACLSSGLVFNNLTSDSIFFAGGKLLILPTTYLIPFHILRYFREKETELFDQRAPLNRDLNNLGRILKLFSRYLDNKHGEKCALLAEGLIKLDQNTSGKEFKRLLDELAAFSGSEADTSLILSMRNPPYTPHPNLENRIKKAALRASNGERQLIILKGKTGEGKTSFLEYTYGKMKEEWGLKSGTILSDPQIFENGEELDSGDEFEFLLVDDHGYHQLLESFVIERVFTELDNCRLVMIVTNSGTSSRYIDAICDMAEKTEFNINRIRLPFYEDDKKDKILSYITSSDSGIPDSPESLGGKIMSARMRARNKTGGDGSNILSRLDENERSILTFMAVFNHQMPLSILEKVYITEDNGIYRALQNLRAIGLVRAKAEKSMLAGGELSVIYGLAGYGIASLLKKEIDSSRRKRIHQNIALILREIEQVPVIYMFYHLACSGKKEDAAGIGYRLFKKLFQRKCSCAIRCFYYNFREAELDSALPRLTRCKLLLDLGNHFALTGDVDESEKLFRLCSDEADASDDSAEFRGIAVESVRKECEILEKKGEFLRGENLLQDALDSYGKYLPSYERARLYNDLAWIHYRIGQYNRSWENCLLVHKLLSDKQHPAEIAQAYNLMGAINWNRSKYEDAVLCHKRCLSLREEFNDPIGIAASYNNLGLVNRSMGKFNQALEYFKKSMEIKKKHNNMSGLAAAHLNLALTYLDIEKLNQAYRNAATAAKLAEDTGNQQLLAEVYGTMGEINFRRGNFDKAREGFFRSLHICHRTMSLREKGVTFRRLADLCFAEGKITEAKELLAQARELSQKIDSRLEMNLLNILDAKIRIAEGKREEGKRKLESSGIELMLLGRKNIAAEVSAEIGELYLEEENEPLAREYLNRALTLIHEDQNLPHQIRKLKETLEKRTRFSMDDISSDFDRFRALCYITSIIRTIHDPEKLHRTLTETARKITSMDRAVLITSRGKDDGRYNILAASDNFDCQKALRNKDILAILELTKRLGYPLEISPQSLPRDKVSPRFIKEHPSIICTPLYIHEEINGFLYMDSSSRSSDTSDKTRIFLTAISQQIALALERILLSEKIPETEKPVTGIKAKPGNKEDINTEGIIGNSPSIKRVIDLISGIKEMNTTVLLTGASGSGKDLVAKTIHYNSPRSDKPFHSINCSAIPHSLLESELFGHEKGAFTGAHRRKIGHFELANHGTIFLNEIGELPLSLQPKLLKVLENQKFYRVGGTAEITTDVRIIAATNRDLFNLVKEGKFREDLYYRINIFPIRIPPLKERREDIEPLCNYALSTFCRLYNIPRKKISPEAMAYLKSFDWPGNVRELENTINRLIIISKRDTILPEDLPDYIVKRPQTMQMDTDENLEETIQALLKYLRFSKGDPILPKVEGMLVEKIVEQTKDKTRAAKLLGISKPTLYSKLRKNRNER